ncbi:MAG: hypothetical protein ABUL67_00105, partial [Haliangium ochraceum]
MRRAFAVVLAAAVTGGIFWSEPAVRATEGEGVVPVAVYGDFITVTVTAGQQILTLGLDTGTTLSVTVTGPGADEATPGRTQVTVGELGPLVAGPRPGSFVAEYRLPQDRQPQSAIVAVEVLLPGGRRAHGTAHLMLPAVTDFPLRTSPNAAVSLEIAGTVFGPRKADAAGNVRVPIVVPPGVATGLARAVNRFGVTKETEVDLQPQEYPRVLLIASPTAVAGDPVDVEVWAVEVSGDPSLPEDIDLSATAGRIRRLGGVPGVAAFSFTPPGRLNAGPSSPGGVKLPVVEDVQLTASMGDGTSPVSAQMAVRSAPVAALAITSDARHLVVASHAVGHLTVSATDKFGNPVAADGVRVTADGESLPVQITGDRAMAEVGAPETWHGRERIAIQAAIGGVRSAMDLPLTGGVAEVVSLSASARKVDANGTSAVELVLSVTDAHGTPTSAERVVWRTDDDGSIEALPAHHLGTLVARFVPRRALRDRVAVIDAVVGPALTASTRILVEAGATRTAAVRIGVASNLGGAFGQAAFVEGTVPLTRVGRFGRLLSAGVGVGYVHSALTTSRTAGFPGVQIDVSQVPVLALGRVRVPGALPVEISVSGAAGMTFASTAIMPGGEVPFGPSHGTAHALVVGGGVDAAF